MCYLKLITLFLVLKKLHFQPKILCHTKYDQIFGMKKKARLNKFVYIQIFDYDSNSRVFPKLKITQM